MVQVKLQFREIKYRVRKTKDGSVLYARAEANIEIPDKATKKALDELTADLTGMFLARLDVEQPALPDGVSKESRK